MRERLLVLGLRKRVDRPDLLAAALQPLDPALQVRALGLGQRLGGRLGLQPEPLGQAAELRAGVAGGVARLLGADLAARDGLAALLQPGVDLLLAGGAGAQLAGELLAGRAVGLELGAERLGLRRDRAARGLERGRQALRGGPQLRVAGEARLVELDPPRALGPLALRALGEPLLGGDRGLQLGAALRVGALVGRPAALVDQPAGVALGLGGLVAGAGGGAGGALGLVAAAVGLGDRLRGRLDPRERGLLGLRGLLDARPRARRGGCARPARGPRRRRGPGAARAWRPTRRDRRA